jgi:hypothetical protein
MSGVIDTLVCPKITLSSGEPSWDSLSDFDSALELPLHYLRGPKEGFRPANVRIGWSGNRFLVLATMTDDEVYTDSQADNDELWALGDVFEIFFRDQAGEEYFELHTSPAGHRLLLKFPGPNSIYDLRDGVGNLTDFMFTGDMLVSRIRKTTDGWQVLASVDWPQTPLEGRKALISLCRYDYTRGQEEPLLSSTSLHEVVNYHRQEDWMPVVFAA